MIKTNCLFSKMQMALIMGMVLPEAVFQQTKLTECWKLVQFRDTAIIRVGYPLFELKFCEMMVRVYYWLLHEPIKTLYDFDIRLLFR